MTGRRVAVTGLGAISALGCDLPTLWAGMRDGMSGVRPLGSLAYGQVGVRSAAQVQDFDPAAHFSARQLPALDRASQLALVAAREAWRDAGTPSPAPERSGVVLGAPIGIETHDAASQALYADDAKRLHPLTVPRIMANAPASHLSIEFGLRGPSFAVASACASAAHAIGLAFQMVRGGMLDLAVCGGSDASFTYGFLKAWEALRILSPDVCRPFSRDRAGLVLGEGAGIVILEPWDDAIARGATPIVELAGFGMSADAADMIAPSAEGAAQAMRAALDDAGMRDADIDYVNAHGTGTRLNDVTETRSLTAVFGERLPALPVSSVKSMIGHCLNAAGALEFCATSMALRDGVLPPTIGFREPDPECALDCVPNHARPARLRAALSNSFAFGGLNAVLALRAA